MCGEGTYDPRVPRTVRNVGGRPKWSGMTTQGSLYSQSGTPGPDGTPRAERGARPSGRRRKEKGLVCTRQGSTKRVDLWLVPSYLGRTPRMREGGDVAEPGGSTVGPSSSRPGDPASLPDVTNHDYSCVWPGQYAL